MNKKKDKSSEKVEIPLFREIYPERSEKAMLDGLKSEHCKHTVFGVGLKTETHNPPSLIPGGGIHIQVGEDIIPHRDLEEVLAGCFKDPHTGMGGRARDVFGPIDYGNEMPPGPSTPLDLSEERKFLLSVLGEEKK